MNIGFYHRGIDAELLAVFQAEFHGLLHYGSVNGCQCVGGEPVEGTVESIVLGDSVGVKQCKAAQGIAIIDALGQFAVVPVLDAHESQRSQGLFGGDAVAPSVGLFQAPLQILAHLLDKSGMLLQEVGDTLQSGIKMDTLTLQLEIGEAELGYEAAAHFFFSARSSSRLISQMRSKEALSIW